MYQSNENRTRRLLGAGLAVGALQLGIGAALVTTFAGGAISVVIRGKLIAHDWTYVPPPPPRPSPTAHVVPHHDDPVVAPVPQVGGFTGPATLTIGPVSPLPPVGDSGGAWLTDIAPKFTPPPAQPPVAARPLGDPSTWITPYDYPSRALREGWSGVTRMHLVIGSDGRVTGCTVVASSGHDALDAVACEKVTQRARFSPARDGSGASREGSYTGAIRWQIHEE